MRADEVGTLKGGDRTARNLDRFIREKREITLYVWVRPDEDR